MLRLRRLLALAGIAVSLAAPAAPVVASSPPALGDQCLIGRWVEQSHSAPGDWTWPEAGSPTGPPVIAVSGLAGLVITYTAGGTQTSDYSNAQPIVGSYQGQQLNVVIRGSVTIGVHADGHQMIVTGAPTGKLTSTWHVDGVIYPYGSVSVGSGTALVRYTCSAHTLHIESPALHAGYGPAVDVLTRVLSGAPGSLLSTFGTSLATPSEVLAAPLTLLTSALVALALVLLVTFPSHLFNRTYEENHDVIRDWWERRFPWLRRRRWLATARGGQRLRQTAGYLAVVLVGGILAALLDPGFGANLRTAALFIGAVFALLAGSLLSAGSAGVYRLVRGGAGPWHLHALPSGLAVAGVCVLISRLTEFQPGYLYGLIGGIVFSRALSSRQEGHVVAVSSLVTLAVAVGAWLAWVPVSNQSVAHPASFGWALASNFLAALFVSGMVGLLIGLVPLKFLPGEKLAGWHRGVWGAVFGLAALSVIEVMLRPQSAGARVASVPFWTTVGLFVGFGSVSILFWSYFRIRRERVRTREAH